MSKGVPSIRRIIANTINEKAFGDPDALAGHIIDVLTENRIWIVPEDTALGAQPFDEFTPEMRPQDPAGNGKGWWFQTSEHEARSPTPCSKQLGPEMQRGVGPFRSRSPEVGIS